MSKKMFTLLCLTLLLGVSSIQVVNGGSVTETASRGCSLLKNQNSQQTMHIISSSVGDIQWSQSYGDIGDDWGYAVIQTADRGFVLAGTTFNNETGDYDAWLVKTDTSGMPQWDQLYGSYADDWAYTIIQTADGGFAFAGTTYSGSFGLGEWDGWLVKTDASGEYQWDQLYGTDEDDEVYAIIQTADGGFALTGTTFDNETGNYDAWLVKTDVGGDQQWDQIFGSYEDDWGYAVIQTADGGFVLAGTTFNNETGDNDAWLLKTDASGEYQWDQLYGTDEADEAYAAIQTADGGFALTGTTFDNETGDYDAWLVKTDASGEYQWDQLYGTDKDDEAYAAIQTTDGGFALAGYTDSSGVGVWDAWLVKTDASGVVEWTQTYGDEEDNWVESVIQTADGKFVLAGTTFNNETDDYDFWLMKAVSPPEMTTIPPEMTTTPPEMTTTPPETTTTPPETTTTPPETTTVPEMVSIISTLMIIAALPAFGVWKKRR